MIKVNFKTHVAVMAIVIGSVLVACVGGGSKRQNSATISESQQKMETAKAGEIKTITIGNIEWATCNLGAEKQSDYGSFFTWAEAQKSCPEGWRLPTKKEYDDLLKLSNNGIWGTLDGVEGLWLNESGKEQKGLFLPAGGFKEPSSDSIKYQKTCGPYWTSSDFDDSFAFYLYTFANGSFTTLGDNHYDKSYRFTVRCVKK